MVVLHVVGGLFGLLAWLILQGLQRVWHYTFGWLFRTLAGLLDRVSFPTGFFGDVHPLGFVSRWLRSLDKNIDHWLASAAEEAEHLATWLFSRVAFAFHLIEREIEGLAADVYGFARRLILVLIPRLLRAALHFVWAEIRKGARLLARVARDLYRLRDRFLRFVWHALKLIYGAYQRIGGLFAWAKHELLKPVWFLLREVGRLERRFLPKNLQKALLPVFHALGILWLITDNVRRLAVAVVSWQYGLVLAVIRSFTRLGDPFSLNAFAVEVQDLTEGVIDLLGAALHEFNPPRPSSGAQPPTTTT